MSNFEKDIRDVFEEAEFTPSERVWHGVEAALQDKKKKRGVFFMWQTYGVAAGLILALTFGFLYNEGYLSNTQPADGQLSELKEEGKEGESTSGSELSDKDEDRSSAGETKEAISPKEGDGINGQSSERNITTPKTKPEPTDRMIAAIDDRTTETGNDELIRTSSDPLLTGETMVTLQASTPGTIDLAISKAYRNSLAAEMLIWNSRINLVPMTTPSLELQTSTNEPKAFRQMSLNGSLGNNILNLSSDQPNVGFTNLATLRDPNSFNALSESTENGEDQALGAISAGGGVSFELSDRLTLGLGLRYSEFRFRNTSNSYSIENGEALPIYLPVGFDNREVFFVGSYELTNTIQSLFLQSTIGYKLVSFGKFDLTAQVGLGLDYFISYKVQGDLNFLETRKVDLSNSDLLNKTNLSGISGIGVNYRINPKLGLSLDMNYRKFFNKSGDLGPQPSSVLGFGLSLNYFLGRKED